MTQCIYADKKDRTAIYGHFNVLCKGVGSRRPNIGLKYIKLYVLLQT